CHPNELDMSPPAPPWALPIGIEAPVRRAIWNPVRARGAPLRGANSCARAAVVNPIEARSASRGRTSLIRGMLRQVDADVDVSRATDFGDRDAEQDVVGHSRAAPGANGCIWADSHEARVAAHALGSVAPDLLLANG